MTLPRMGELVDAHLAAARRAMFDMGVAVNAAMSDKPQEALMRILSPPREIKPEELPPMLRIPKDRTKRSPTKAERGRV